MKKIQACLLTGLFLYGLSLISSQLCLNFSVCFSICYMLQKKLNQALFLQFQKLKKDLLKFQKFHKPLGNMLCNKRYLSLIIKVQILHSHGVQSKQSCQQKQNTAEQSIAQYLIKLQLKLLELHKLQKIKLYHYKNPNQSLPNQNKIMQLFESVNISIKQLLQQINLNWSNQQMYAIIFKAQTIWKVKQLALIIYELQNFLFSEKKNNLDVTNLSQENKQLIKKLQQIFQDRLKQGQNQNYVKQTLTQIDKYMGKYNKYQKSTLDQPTVQTVYQFSKGSEIMKQQQILKNSCDSISFDRSAFKYNLNNLLIKRMHNQSIKRQQYVQYNLMKEQTLKLQAEYDITKNQYRIKEIDQQERSI